MNDLQMFNSSEFGSVRTVCIDGEPWLVGKDVAVILGYSNPQKAIRDHVDDDDKGVNELFTPGGKQNLLVINESGFYSLVLSSKLPEAKKFKHWVTSEVLPSIRKHGLYAKDELLADPDLFIAALTELKEARAKNAELQKSIDAQSEQLALQDAQIVQQGQHIAQQNVAISYMKPKADYCDRVLACKEAVSITVIAKDYGWSAIEMNRFLQEHRVQFRRGNQWFLYQKYAKFGYTVTRTKVITDRMGTEHTEIWTYWTQKGRLFIYEFLKERGILPIYERPTLPLPNVPHYQPPCKKEVDV